MAWKSIRLFLAENDLALLQQAIDSLQGAQLWPNFGRGARPTSITYNPSIFLGLTKLAENSKCDLLLLGERRPCVYREAIQTDGSGVNYRASMLFNTNAVLVEFGFWRPRDKLLVPIVFSSAGETEISTALLNELKVALRSVAAGSKGISVFLPHAGQLIESGWKTSDNR